MARYLYSELSSLLQARKTCRERGSSDEWFHRHTDTIEFLVKNHLPSGSGFDCGTKLDWELSHPEKLVFHTSYHHMAENGMYYGWTEHTITVTPSLSRSRYHLRISGRNRNEIKDYIHESFDIALTQDVEFELMQRVFDVELKPRWSQDGSAIETWSGTARMKETTGLYFIATRTSQDECKTAVLKYLETSADKVIRHEQ